MFVYCAIISKFAVSDTSDSAICLMLLSNSYVEVVDELADPTDSWIDL